MRVTILFILVLAAVALAQPQAQAPDWEDGTYWVSHRYSDQVALSYTQGSLIHSYVWDSFCRHEPTHFTYKYSNFTVSRITFQDTGQKLATTLPLLSFPLEPGKSWQYQWTVQKKPAAHIYTYPVSIQVLGTEPFSYYGTQEAYLLQITLNNSVNLTFHYVPANSTFPGQPPMEVYEEIESGQPFRLLGHGTSKSPGPELAEPYRSQICPKQSPIQQTIQKITQKLLSFVTRLLQLRPS